MENIIIIAGIWTAILPCMKWNKIGRKLSFFHLVAGLYTCISIIVYRMDDVLFSYIWVQVAYMMMCILLIVEIIIKLKKQKAALDVLAIVTSILGSIISVVVFCIDSREISSAIIIVVGSMIILSIPFYELGTQSVKSEK